MDIEAVVFDIGNVLIAWQPEQRYDALIGARKRRRMFAEFDFHAMMTRIDSGGDFAEEVERAAAAHPGWRDEILMVRDRWDDLARPEIPHSVRLMRALRTRGVPVFALSNFGAGNFPLSEAAHPFLKEFDRRYISGQMGMAKPDPRIYAAVEADCGVRPQALLFADDRAENVEAARARGWGVHLFGGPEGFARELAALGLLSGEETR